jgi:hypothetical protein
MKKVIITFILVSWMLILFAQSNPQIVDDAKKWTYLSYQPWSPGFYKQSYYIRMTGDTVINQKNYLKIWETDNSMMIDWYVIGYAREDTNGDVYFKRNSEEGLAYKFDVSVGDTFTMNNPFHMLTFTAEILDIDTINIEPSNQNRKRIKLSEYNGTWSGEEYWIEGIGSMAGIILSGNDVIPLTGAEYYQLCQWEYDLLVFSNPEWDDCFITVSTEENKKPEPCIIIQSNPMIDQSIISVNSLDSKNLSIDIYDIFGKLVKTYPVDQDDKIVLQRSQFKSSLYIISLKDGNKTIAREKLLIQ